MGETLTVRLFVSTQTYDIPCDPRQPARWLLQQARNIQRTALTPQQKAQKREQQQQTREIQDELEVLYNRTRRAVIELDEPIGRSISALDVIDARTLRQTPDTNTSSLFPWLNSYSGGPKVHDENLSSANGLFFQQLYAYTLIGRRTPQTASQRREKQKREEFLDLLKAYVVGSFQEDQPQIEVSYASTHHQGGYNNGYSAKTQQQQPTYYTRPVTPSTPAAPAPVQSTSTPARRASDFPTIKGFFSSSSTPAPAPSTPVSVRRKIEYADRDSDSGSEHADDTFAHRMISLVGGGEVTPSRNTRTSLPPPSPSPPTLMGPSTPVRRATTDGVGNLLDEMESVFDVVFKQQQIGLKLAMDEYKQYAIVKECLPGMEAQSYAEIQSGVVVLAVNGQEVNGLGLARLLYRLREVPRPVVVRFGRIAQRGEADERQKRVGTWG